MEVFHIVIKIIFIFFLFFSGLIFFALTVFYNSPNFHDYSSAMRTQFALLFNDNLFHIYIRLYNDHRISMSIAPLSMKINSISFENKNVVNKSYPDFWKDLETVGISCINS
jgi:hypothetical protein